MANPYNPPAGFAYTLMFGGWPTPDATKVLQLPKVPGLPDAQLYDVTTAPGIDGIVQLAHNDSAFLNATYQRIAHPVLDSDAQQRLDSWKHCHNGLYTARRCDWLDSEQIYHLTDQLLTWIQDQQDARLLGRAAKNWWVVPEAYVLHVRDAGNPSQDPLPPAFRLGDPTRVSAAQGRRHEKLFDEAIFTVHLVHCNTDHWGVMIYQVPTGRSWYLDSLHDAHRNERSTKARAALVDWLQRSGRPAPTGVPAAERHETSDTRKQEDGWSCGLHVVANAMAFIRFEVRGWHKIEQLKMRKSKGMRKELLVCLHHLMGLKYDPDAKAAKPQLQTSGQPVLKLRPKGQGKPQAAVQPAQPIQPVLKLRPKDQGTGQAKDNTAQAAPEPTATAQRRSPRLQRQQAAASQQQAAPAKPTAPPAPAAPPPNSSGVRRVPRGRALVEKIRQQAQADQQARVDRLRKTTGQGAGGKTTGTASTPVKTPKRKADAMNQDGSQQTQSTPRKKPKSADTQPRAVQSSPLRKSPRSNTGGTAQAVQQTGTKTSPAAARTPPKRKADAMNQDDGPQQAQSTPRKRAKLTDTQPRQAQSSPLRKSPRSKPGGIVQAVKQTWSFDDLQKGGASPAAAKATTKQPPAAKQQPQRQGSSTAQGAQTAPSGSDPRLTRSEEKRRGAAGAGAVSKKRKAGSL